MEKLQKTLLIIYVCIYDNGIRWSKILWYWLLAHHSCLVVATELISQAIEIYKKHFDRFFLLKEQKKLIVAPLYPQCRQIVTIYG